jgi:hypothetical protein
MMGPRSLAPQSVIRTIATHQLTSRLILRRDNDDATHQKVLARISSCEKSRITVLFRLKRRNPVPVYKAG